jgi:hypothetical protein
MTPEKSARLLWRLTLLALVVALLGSLAFVVFADFFAQFPYSWG